jgi:hypothetical protein
MVGSFVAPIAVAVAVPVAALLADDTAHHAACIVQARFAPTVALATDLPFSIRNTPTQLEFFDGRQGRQVVVAVIVVGLSEVVGEEGGAAKAA